MTLALFREDLTKHSQGSPCYVDDITFYVARMGTKDSQAQIIEIREKLYGLFPKPADVDESEVIANWLAYYGVIGWDDLFDDDNDKKVEFSKTEARRIFLNKEYWLSINQILLSHAHNYENYLQDKADKEADELKKP